MERRSFFRREESTINNQKVSMNINQDDTNLLDSHMGCYGHYKPADPICKNLCAINLRCAAEQNKNIRVELLEDLMSAGATILKIQ